MALYLPLNDHNRPIKQHLKREHYEMSTNASNNQPPKQQCKNVVNFLDKERSDSSNRSSSSEGKPYSQSSVPRRVTTINCGNNTTTNYNYHTVPIPDKIIKTPPKVIIFTHATVPVESTKKSHQRCFPEDNENNLSHKTKRAKLKSVKVTLMPPSTGNYLESSHSQGGIVKIEPSTEVEEVQILPTPKREDFKIIDVDAEVPVQDEIKKGELERIKRYIKSKSRVNCQIIESYYFLFEFDNRTKIKKTGKIKVGIQRKKSVRINERRI